MAKLVDKDLGLKLGHHALVSNSACSLTLIHKNIRCPHTMQKHPHTEMLSSVISTLQTRTTACITTHIDKTKIHNDYMAMTALITYQTQLPTANLLVLGTDSYT
jgi:cytochrome c